ncbi:hypothetical protein SteCoe_33499 [Stentor coeruleus]|uniref:C2H2-type domain-containing protein n=1 Tax=Stentor coeruleus TaxID=5963 RepID=A0A1R2AWM5_9CILI|nr:hypothetical protein SteCoe_33499 [Stentor coeruleus]
MFACRFKGCSKQYSTKYSLQRHCLIRHNKSKRFSCKICKKILSSNQNLKEHFYTHSNEKPLICPVRGCSKLFRQSSQLSAHKKIHLYAMKSSKVSQSINYLKLTELLKTYSIEGSQSEEQEFQDFWPEIPQIFEPEGLKLILG